MERRTKVSGHRSVWAAPALAGLIPTVKMAQENSGEVAAWDGLTFPQVRVVPGATHGNMLTTREGAEYVVEDLYLRLRRHPDDQGWRNENRDPFG